MASRGASLFAFFFCNEKKKGGFGAPPKNSYISLKAAQKGLNLENGLPTKCERGTKCYFVPRALKSQLTTSRPPFFLSVDVQSSARVRVCRLFFQICAVWVGLSLGAVWLNAT